MEMKKRTLCVMSILLAMILLATVNNGFALENQASHSIKRELNQNSLAKIFANSALLNTGNVQISHTQYDENHPSITGVFDGSVLVAYDQTQSPLVGHVYFARSTDNGGTWTNIWDTNIDIGGMDEGLQNWPVIAQIPNVNKVIGFWNDEISQYNFFTEVTSPEDPEDYSANTGGFDQTDWDYDRSDFTIAAYNENRFGFGHVGHVIYAGYDLPSACQISYFTTGIEGGMQSTGDEDYPIGYHSEMVITQNYYWYAWENPNDDTGKRDIIIKWGDGVQDTDAHLWPEKRFSLDADCIDPAFKASGNNLCLVYQINDNVYGDFDLACAYSVDEGVTWQESRIPTLPQVDELCPEIYIVGSTVFCTFVRNNNLFLTKSTDMGATWSEPEQINDVSGQVVSEPGAVDVSPAGIVWVDTRNGNRDIYYAALPTAIITIEVTGGFGVSALVANDGNVDAEDVPWSIDLSGLVVLGGHSEGTIAVLPPGGAETISPGLILGLGPTTITVNVGGTVVEADGMALGPLILGL